MLVWIRELALLIQKYVLFAYSRKHIIDCKATLAPFLLGNASSAAVSMASIPATLRSGAEPFNMEAWNWLDETSREASQNGRSRLGGVGSLYVPS
jgi:hypothetical protein